jgi:mono/diheme cytochrome c family protein
MQSRIVLIKSILTIFALLFAVVLPSLALTAWFSTRLSEPMKSRFFTIHRWLGRSYILIIFTVGVVYCLITLGVQGYDQRVFTHSGLGLAVVALLIVKVLTVRGKIPPLSDHLPKLGSMLAVITIGIFLTSAFWYFRTQAAGSVASSPAYPANASAAQAASSQVGKAVFEQQCSQCHSPARATSAPRSRAEWAATIQRMVSQHSANISAADQAAILDYLSTNFAK